MRTVWQWFLVPVAAYLLLVAAAYLFQSQLVYFPGTGREVEATPRAMGLDFEPVTIATDDGERLAAWWVPAQNALGTVLFFHGNAGNISQRLEYLAMFHRLRYSTLAVDYRGYGGSTGTPSEEGTYRDASASWDYLRHARLARERDIVIVGESLGGAVAAWLAARVGPRAVVLASTFKSVPDLGAEVYPFLPVRLIARIRYDTISTIPQIGVPVLVAHSPEDEIIPYRHGRALFDAAREPKRFLVLAGGHNDGFLYARGEWVAALGAFLEEAQTAGARVP